MHHPERKHPSGADQPGREAQILKVTDIAEIAAHGVMSTPALVIDDKVVSVGKVLSASDVEKLLGA